MLVKDQNWFGVAVKLAMYTDCRLRLGGNPKPRPTVSLLGSVVTLSLAPSDAATWQLFWSSTRTWGSSSRYSRHVSVRGSALVPGLEA